ncbi:MAG: phage tail tape measure protein [Caldilineaceae bacterium]
MADYKIRLIVEGVDRASGALGGALGSLQRIGEFAAGNLLARGIESAVRGAAAVAGTLGGWVVEAGNFDAQIDSIMSKLGGTAQDAGKLRDLIYDLGIDPNLKVSTQEAADAVEMLVQNGLGLDDVLGGAARSTVLLANATGADFSRAADIATDAMAVFGLGAEDMQGAVDSIAAVTVNSKFDINDYALALAQGGAAAQIAGLSMEEFNTAVVAMSSFFNSGSDAGTSFKTMMQRLVPQTDEAADAMRSLGLNFTNADGSMKSMAEIAGELNRVFQGQVTFSSTVGGRTAAQADELKRLQGVYGRTQAAIRDYETGVKGATYSDEKRQKKLDELRATLAATEQAMQPLLEITGQQVQTTRALTEEEKIRYLTTIFGADAMRAAAALAGYSEEEFAALMETLGESDAELAAAQRMDNLAGDMEIFSGVVETLRLQIGDKFQPAARAFVQALTGIAEAAGPGLISAAGAVADWIAPYADAIGVWVEDAIDKFSRMYEAMEGGVPGAMAGTAAITGGKVFYDAEAKVTTVDWGAFTYSYDAEAGVTSVDWTNFLGAAGGFKYDAEAGISYVHWDDGTFTYTYDAEAGVRLVQFGNFTWNYDAVADIQYVNFRNFTWTYDVSAGVTKINWNPLGAVASFEYDAEAGIRKVHWDDGTLTYIYDAEANVSSVQFGNYTTTYDSQSAITSVDWGNWAYEYNASAGVESVQWGKFSYTYDSNAKVGSVSWGNWTHEYTATARVNAVLGDGWDWITKYLGGRMGGGSGASEGGGDSGRAIGERNWGGGLVKVHRDEVLALPRGAHIFTASEARAMAAGGAGGPQITINANVANGLDINEMASRVADVLRLRGR